MDLGYLVAIYFVGRLLFSSFVCTVAEHYSYKISLLVANLILGIGALLWSISYAAGYIGTLYISQFFLGMGSATYEVVRSYIVDKTSVKRQSFLLSRLAAIQVNSDKISITYNNSSNNNNINNNSNNNNYYHYRHDSYDY